VFCLAHPTDDPGVTGLVTHLGDRLERGRILGMQEITGRLTVHSAVDTKDEIRGLIRKDLLILSGLANLAGVKAPGLAALFRLPPARLSHHAFLTTTRAMLARAESHGERFLALGMPANLLQDLTTLVGQYEEAVVDKQSATSAHIGANADLEAVAREVMLIVHLLDRIFEVRYRKNGELLAAWKSAKEVVGSARRAPDRPQNGAVEAA
jgi:hypothetical protein